ncbi:hypothetical protein BDA96_01G334300 [Sorghum bicolor]|uniref:Uncharacterized protein n=2 Tax=Sorghum bicolor TaxID=4558 RepID=A0A1B6QM52_SORBI|nr:hypothetical protein BDA96_01G334300 [Sorghum bicolor]KXG38999.1 hypothetical protein SORBI_3001G311700 [Sorghum bicolor]
MDAQPFIPSSGWFSWTLRTVHLLNRIAVIPVHLSPYACLTRSNALAHGAEKPRHTIILTWLRSAAMLLSAAACHLFCFVTSR